MRDGVMFVRAAFAVHQSVAQLPQCFFFRRSNNAHTASVNSHNICSASIKVMRCGSGIYFLVFRYTHDEDTDTSNRHGPGRRSWMMIKSIFSLTGQTLKKHSGFGAVKPGSGPRSGISPYIGLARSFARSPVFVHSRCSYVFVLLAPRRSFSFSSIH